MTFWLLLAAGLPLLILILITTLNATLGPRLSRAPRGQRTRPVSILIPARNEEMSIGDCLSGLLQQRYPELEILVLDDHSTDQSGAIVRRLAEKHANLTYLAGKPLPDGWSGKNWACHQLQQRATGDILIFTDADNTHHPDAVAGTVSWMERHRLGLFSVFPQQIVRSLPEKLVVPMAELLFYSFLAHWMVLFTRTRSIAGANGQWIAFSREAYDLLGGHRSVRQSAVEDVLLARRAKKLRIRSLVGSGKERVFARMYTDWESVYNGFSKNLFVIGSGQTIPYFFFLLLLTFIFLVPYFLLFIPSLWHSALILISLNVLLRLILAASTGHNLLESMVLHPFGAAATILIGWNSMRWYHRGEIHWKGRSIRNADKMAAEEAG